MEELIDILTGLQQSINNISKRLTGLEGDDAEIKRTRLTQATERVIYTSRASFSNGHCASTGGGTGHCY